MQLDRLADEAPEHRLDAFDDGGEIDHALEKDLFATEREQLMRELGGSIRRLDDLLEIFAHAVPRRRSQQGELGVPGDDREEIVEVVRHAAGQRPDGLELLRLAELGLAFLEGVLDALALLYLLAQIGVGGRELHGPALELSALGAQRCHQGGERLVERVDFRRDFAHFETALRLGGRRHAPHVADERAQRPEHRSRDEHSAKSGEENGDQSIHHELEHQGPRVPGAQL